VLVTSHRNVDGDRAGAIYVSQDAHVVAPIVIGLVSLVVVAFRNPPSPAASRNTPT